MDYDNRQDTRQKYSVQNRLRDIRLICKNLSSYADLIGNDNGVIM